MVELKDIEQRARRQFEKARVMKPWVTKLAWRVYRVRGRFVGTGTYTVTFSVIDGKRFGHCECKAGKLDQPCYHLAAAYKRHLTNARRAQATARQTQPEQPATHFMVMPLARAA